MAIGKVVSHIERVFFLVEVGKIIPYSDRKLSATNLSRGFKEKGRS